MRPVFGGKMEPDTQSLRKGSPAGSAGFFFAQGGKVRIFTPFLLLLSFSMLQPVFAAEEDQPATDETIVVTADRIEEQLKDTGSAVTVITKDEISRLHASFVQEVLRSVPGLNLSQSGSVGKVTTVFTRGAGSDQTLVLMDGVQLNDSLNFVDLSTLSTNNIERIEVVRGPQSTVYGSDAMGGVINIITRNAGELLSGKFEAGSDSTFNGSVRSGVGTDRNNAALEYSAYQTDGETINDDYDNRTLGLNAHVQVTPLTALGLLYRKYRTKIGIPQNSGTPSPNRRQDTDSALFHVPFRQEITNWWNAQADYSIFDQELHFKDPNDPFGFTFSNSDSRTKTLLITNNFHLSENQNLLAGYENERIRVSEVSSFGVSLDNDKVSNNAVFAQYQTSQWNPITLTLGIRTDHHSVFGSRTYPRVSVAYRPLDGIRIHGMIGKGFRAPRPAELTGPFGNPDLNPESVTGWDSGLDYEMLNGRLYVSGTVFHNQYDDLIDFDRNTFRLKNFKKVTTSGLEMEAHIRPLRSLQVRGVYTFLKTEDKTIGQQLLRRPKNSGSIDVDYRFEKFGANFHWQLVGKRFDFNDLTLLRVLNDAYNKADLVFSYDLTSSIQLYTRITNVFDNRYQEVFGFPSPDRGIFTGIKLN
jgi:vitamin B12 transporter